YFGAEMMCVAVGRRRRQPRPQTRRLGDIAVEADRSLENHKWAPLCHERKIRLIDEGRLRGTQTNIDLDSARPQECESLTAHAWIWILQRRHDARDACLDDPDHARPGSSGNAWANRAAGLERAVERRSLRPRARHLQRAHFRVRCSSALVMTVADDNAVGGNDYRSDHRVRARAAAAARRMKKRAVHVVGGS